MTQTAVLMMAYGSPESLEDVEAFLLDVRNGRAASPELLQEIKDRYIAIGGKSPLMEITRAQAQALEIRLNKKAESDLYRVFVGMRHSSPTIDDVIGRIVHLGIKRITAFCMTPFASKISSDAYFQRLDEALESRKDILDMNEFELEKIHSWHEHPDFIRAVCERTAVAIERFPEVLQDSGKVLFTAHSLPVAASEGDPYPQQLRAVAQRIAEEMKILPSRWEVCYQSAGASNVPWLGPPLEETLLRLAGEDIRNVLVVPAGFVSDHIEVLFDLDIEARQLAHEHGIRLERSESLNTSPRFIEALAQMIETGEI